MLDQNAASSSCWASGPRLDGYLAQIEERPLKLDFASWGGFAQNYAGRRIAFENAASPKYWDRAATEQLSIPTFASGPSGPYLPAAAMKGALRTGFLFGLLRDNTMRNKSPNELAATVRCAIPAASSKTS